MSKFTEKLLELLEIENFEDLECNCYNLGNLPNHPTLNDLFNRLTERGKLDFVKTAGSDSIEKFMQSYIYQDMKDDPQDFENCDIECFTEDKLILRIGGYWQLPAIIKYEFINGEIAITDFYYESFDKINTHFVNTFNEIYIDGGSSMQDMIDKSGLTMSKMRDEVQKKPEYKEKQISLLKIKMQKAVDDEEFILAAKYRDEIKELEKQLNKNN